MKFTIVDNKSGKYRSFNANSFIVGVALAGLMAIPAASGYFAYRLGVGEAALTGEMVDKWRDVLDDQKESIDQVR